MTYIPDESYDKSAGADRGVNVNPDSQANAYSDPVVDGTNETGAPTTYREVVSLENYKDGSITWDISANVVLTFWVSNDPDADDSADTGWQDVTTEFTGGASVTGADSGTTLLATIRVAKLMIKRVISSGTNTSNVWVSKGN